MLRARNESATNPLATESLGSGDAATEHAIGKRLLVVEDNELNMEIVEFMLKSAGAEVAKAFDGESAVRAFAADPAGYDATFDGPDDAGHGRLGSLPQAPRQGQHPHHHADR